MKKLLALALALAMLLIGAALSESSAAEETEAQEAVEEQPEESAGETGDQPEETAEASEEQPEETADGTEKQPEEPEEQPEEDGPGSLKQPIAAGESFTFETEITLDGLARAEAGEEPYATIALTVTLTGALEPDYYQNTYASVYKLSGTEACAILEVTLEEAGGLDSVILQDAVLVRMADETGLPYDGYQMMDSEIAGYYDVEAVPGEPRTFYKRYAFNPEIPMKYVVITYYSGGEAANAFFLLENPLVYEELKNGAMSETVKALQTKLIEMGFLAGRADGIFGKKTEEAIRAAQEAAGMEVTGIADNAFQHYLYD